MENAYQPELWRDAYVMLGTSAAALIGLLFVVMSIHLDDIVNNRVYRIRVRNNLFYLFVMVVEATLILIPQPAIALGIEYAAINFLLLLLHARNLYVSNTRIRPRAAAAASKATPRFDSSRATPLASLAADSWSRLQAGAFT